MNFTNINQLGIMTSPPISSEKIMFMTGTSTTANRYVHILTFENQFYEYNGIDNSWNRRLDPPES